MRPFSAEHPDPLLVGTVCPFCDGRLDACSQVDPAQRFPGQADPDVGDLTMCAWCGEFLEFVDAAPDRVGLKVVPLTANHPGRDDVRLIAVYMAWREEFKGPRRPKRKLFL